MVDGLPVNRTAQLEWFAGLSEKKDMIVKSIWHMNKSIVVIGLKNLANSDAEYWGYLGEKSARVIKLDLK